MLTRPRRGAVVAASGRTLPQQMSKCVRGVTQCVVHGAEHHIQRPGTLFVATRQPTRDKTTLRLFITEMVTRSALLVATPKPKVRF